MESLLGSQVVNQKGEKISVTSFSGSGKVVGLYFSAHWCPPCRAFTPILGDFYKALKAAGKSFEIVFVSSDRDQASFQDYYNSMPWLALPFDDRKRKEDLSNKFGVKGIPTFILFDGANGSVIQREGRMKVVEDPTGDEFPWKD